MLYIYIERENIRQHTAAYGSIRQHTAAYGGAACRGAAEAPEGAAGWEGLLAAVGTGEREREREREREK